MRYTDYVVHGETIKESHEIVEYMKKTVGAFNLYGAADWYYRINPSNRSRFGDLGDREYYIHHYPHLPILTFKQWKEMISERKVYRIKTEKEFIEDFGRNWKNKVDRGWAEKMEPLLGKVLTEEEFIEAQNNRLQLQSSEESPLWGITADMVTDKPLNMEKKIIGYKIVKEFPGISDNLRNMLLNNELSDGLSFHVGSELADSYALYLTDTEYFEPIYEEKKYVSLTIGNPLKNVTVSKDGNYFCEGEYGKIIDIVKIIHHFTNISYFPWPIKAIQIGCSLFTLEELDKVVKTYNSEFGKDIIDEKK